MNRFEEYYKDKINWKAFNAILDACIHLEDSNTWFFLSVSYFSNYVSNENKYRYIYRLYNVVAPGHDYKIIQEYTNNPRFEVSKRNYEQYGLFYVLILESDENASKTLNRIRSFRFLKEDNSAEKQLGIKRYVFTVV